MTTELANREQDRQTALRLWMTGATYRAIANTQNCSHTTAYNRVQKAIDDMRPHTEYDRYRAIQLAELELSRRPLRSIIVDTETTITELVAAITTLIKLQEREAKLLGLDRTPTPLDDLHTATDEELADIAEQWRLEYATNA